MPISGTDPLDSDDAQMEFRSIATSIIRRINYYNTGMNDPKGGNPVVADLVALVALCRADKMAGNALGKAQVEEWRALILKWLESVKIPKKFAEEYRANVLKLLDELEGFAANISKGLWEKRAHHLGAI